MVCLALALSGFVLASAPQITAEPSSIVLGRDERVSLRVRSEGSAPLKGAANLGTLVPPADPEAAEQEWIWQPPATRTPATALILLWRDEGGVPDVAALRIPLLGRTELDVDTEPNADVRVEVGKSSFGPRRADAKGHTAMPIEVPPGIASAKVIAQTGGQITTRTVRLEVPPPNPLAAVIAPSPLDGRRGGWLFVAHSERLELAQLELELKGAQATQVAQREDRALYRLTPQSGERRVTAELRLKGDKAAKASAEAEVAEVKLPPPPVPRGRFVPGASVGGFYAGGTNGGPSVAAGLSVRLPIGWDRLFAEGTVGFKTAFLSGTELGLGRFDASVMVVPILVSLRGRAVERERWALDGALGAGIAPFRHLTRSELQPAFSEGGVGFEVFASAQLSYRLTRIELFVEAKVGASPVGSARLRLDAGGVALAIGARYELL